MSDGEYVPPQKFLTFARKWGREIEVSVDQRDGSVKIEWFEHREVGSVQAFLSGDEVAQIVALLPGDATATAREKHNER